MIETNNAPESIKDIEIHIKELDKTFNVYCFLMGLSIALPIIDLVVIYVVDFMKFDIFSIILILFSVFIFRKSFKGASLTARELVIYENMI